ncbi:MAG: hemerythrin domain-containing protein [Gammaproteobacteria bacterium]|jgi:hemerythrin|nr:hemerythrin domain-containing protein [Gammaproteobacteria bacterium]
MAAFLTWRDDLLMGIDVLDADHQEMVRLLNLLVAAGQAPPGPPAPDDDPDPASRRPAAAALEHLDALITHLRGHFEREEAFLRAIRYPDYVDHKREHTMQMAEFVDLRRRLADESTRYVDAETVQSFRHWFFNHVIAEDREYAAYFFKACGGRIPEGTLEQSS